MAVTTMEDFLVQQLKACNGSPGKVVKGEPDSATAANGHIMDTGQGVHPFLAASGSLISQGTLLQAPSLRQHSTTQQHMTSTTISGSGTGMASFTAATDVDSLLHAVVGAAQQIRQKRQQLQHFQRQQQQQQVLGGSASPVENSLRNLLASASQNLSFTAAPSTMHTEQQHTAAATTGRYSPDKSHCSASIPQSRFSSISSACQLSAPGLVASDPLQPGLSGVQHTLSKVSSSMSEPDNNANYLKLLQTISLLRAHQEHKQQQQHQQTSDIAGGVDPAVALAAAAAGLSELGREQDSAVGTAAAATTHQHKLAAKAKQVQALLEQLSSHVRQHQPNNPAADAQHPAAAAAAPTALDPIRVKPADLAAAEDMLEPSGLSSGLFPSASDCEPGSARTKSEVSAGAAAAPPPAAAVKSLQGSSTGTLDQVKLQQVLLQVVETKRQAIACVKVARELGLLSNAAVPDNSLASPEAAKAAAALPDQQQRKRHREDETAEAAAAAEEEVPAKKLHKLSTAAAQTAAAAEEEEGKEAEADVDVEAPDLGRYPSHTSVTSSHTPVAQQQQQWPAATAAAALGTEQAAAGTAAVAPKNHTELLLRTLAVMCKSSKLNKTLAAMIVPCAAEAKRTMAQLAALQQTQQQQDSMQPAAAGGAAEGGSAASQGVPPAVQQLQHQLMLAKVAVSVKQQAILKLQADAAATAAAQTRQLQQLSDAVAKLIAAANADGVDLAHKQQLMGVAAEIVRAVV